MQWLWLSIAIITEVCGTLALRASNGFGKPVWLIITFFGYLSSFYFLSQALKLGMSVGVAYAIWAAIGITVIAIAAKIIWNDPITFLMAVGFVLIIGGVILVELGSKVHV